MYIRRKVFSLLRDENGEEKYFSTTEISSEQREFARKDYEGLTEEGRNALKGKRSQYASALKKAYRRSMNSADKVEINPDTDSLIAKPSISGGGIRTNIEVETVRGNHTDKELRADHKKMLQEQYTTGTKERAGIMRDQVISDHGLQAGPSQKEIDLGKKLKAAEKATETAKAQGQRFAKSAKETAKKYVGEKKAHEATKQTLKRTRIGGGLALAGTAALGGGLYAKERAKNKKLQQEKK